MLDGNEEFLMIDDQKVVFEKIRKETKKTMLSGSKRVFIVEGGPGTGKSVLAINSLVKLLSENDRIVTDFTKRARADKSLNGIKKLYKENPQKALDVADEIIKNTYRRLMTRGQKRCYIYCVDKALGKYLKSRIDFVSENIKFKNI